MGGAMRPSHPRPGVRRVALSAGQEGLWFASCLDPEAAPAYDMLFAFEADGEIDIGLLERTLDVLQDRHELLRAHVESVDGVPGYVIEAPGAASRIRVARCDGPLEAAARAEAGRATPLDAAPLLHVTHVRPVRGGRAGLLFKIPHLVFDGHSADRFFAELGDVARRLAAAQAPAPASDDGTLDAFVRAESAWLHGADGHAAVEAVRTRVAGAATGLRLTRSGAATPLPHVREARVLEFPIEADGLERIAAFAQSRRATPAAVWLGAFELALWRRTGQPDFLVTLPVSQHDRVDNDAALGYFTNLGVARARIEETLCAAAFVDRVADDLLETLEARAVPFRAVASPRRGAARGPLPALSQLGFNYERLQAGMSFRLGPACLRIREMPPRWAKEELKLDVLETPDGARGWLVAARDAFDDAGLEEFAGKLFEILESLLEDGAAPLARLGGSVAA
jgi:hypothetical protein